jgi:hypothetical protein
MTSENEISAGTWIKPPFLDADGNWFDSVTEPWCGDRFLAAVPTNYGWDFTVVRFTETGIETGEGDPWGWSVEDVEWVAKIVNPPKEDNCDEDCADHIRALLTRVRKLEEERAAWKGLALSTRDRFGDVAGLLGTASAYLFAIGTYHKKSQGLPDRTFDAILELDEKITATIKDMKVPIPSVLKTELEP